MTPATALADALAIVEEPAPRTQNRPGAVLVAAEQGQEQFHHVHDDEQRQRHDCVAPPPSGRHDEQLVATLEVLQARVARTDRRDRPLAARRRLAMGHLGERGDDDARPGDLSPPAEVEVLAEHRNERVETAQGGEEVGAHEGRPAGCHEDVAFEVLLAVVDLAQLHALVHHAEAVARLTDVQQYQGVVVGDELGRDDAGVGAEGSLDQEMDDVGLEADVVVTEEEEGRALDHQRRLVAGRGEAAVLLEESHEGVRGDRGHPCRDVFGLPVRDDEQA